MELKKDFKEFVELLNAAGVKYVVAGGYAVAYHGFPRYTKDIDFLIEPSAENAKQVLIVLGRFGLGSLNIELDDLARSDKIVQIGVEPNRIDLFTTLDGVTFDEAYDSRQQIVVDGLPISFLSKPLLVRNKRIVGRPQDLADVARIEELGP
jgi:hypothetical protein